MTVSIRNTDGMSRAGGDQSGNLYEEGLDTENKIESIRFYFFKKDGNPYVVTAAGNSYYDCKEITPTGADMPNIEKKLKAVIVLSSNDATNTWHDIDKMVAVANFEKIIDNLGNDNKKLSELKALVKDYGFGDNLYPGAEDLFVMTSSSFGTDGNNEYGCEVKVTAANIKPTREEAEASPVEMFVERVLAKVRVSTAWTAGMNPVDVTYLNANDPGNNSRSFQAIPLKDSKDKEYIEDSTGNQIYAIFTGWDLSGHTNMSYLFKQVSLKWDETLSPWKWNDPDRHRSYWAMNPKGLEYVRHTHANANAKIGSVRQNGTGDGKVIYDGEVLYCQENAADYSDELPSNPGTKREYDPSEETGNRTQAYLRAVLVNVKDGEATPVDLAIWGDVKYTKQGLIIAMLNSVNDLIYTVADNGDYISLNQTDVKLVTGEEAEMANLATEDSRRYLSYIQLDPDFSKTLYQKGIVNGEDQYKEITLTEANKLLTSMPGARCWEGGDTYYYVDIAHLNTTDNNDAGKGYYGIVRNHIYDIQINSVYGLGTPVLDSNRVIIPQKPSNEAFYLGARLNILSWRVVNQDVELKW